MDLQQVRGDAIARVQARRRPPEYQTVYVAGGETRMQVDRPGAGPFVPPKDASEFFDDRIARTPHGLGPWVEVAYRIALSGSPDAAVAALNATKSLTEWDQWHLWTCLKAWKDTEAPRDAAAVMRAVIAAWGDLELPRTAPVAVPLPVAQQPKRPKVRYRQPWGHPAGAAI